MKKVGIITYHFAQNYGAVLQCYALQTYLSQQGYAVTVFDFVSEKQQKNNDVVKHGASVKTAVANICLLPWLLDFSGRFIRCFRLRTVSEKSMPDL